MVQPHQHVDLVLGTHLLAVVDLDGELLARLLVDCPPDGGGRAVYIVHTVTPDYLLDVECLRDVAVVGHGWRFLELIR